VVKLVTDKPALRALYFPAALARAGSAEFTKANSFANAIESLDASLDAVLSDEQAFQLLTALMRAADIGAWSAKAVVDAKFGSSPQLRAKAIRYIVASPVDAAGHIRTTLGDERPLNEFVAAYLTDAA
jgi:hypothetical protein